MKMLSEADMVAFAAFSKDCAVFEERIEQAEMTLEKALEDIELLKNVAGDMNKQCVDETKSRMRDALEKFASWKKENEAEIGYLREIRTMTEKISR